MFFVVVVDQSLRIELPTEPNPRNLCCALVAKIFCYFLKAIDVLRIFVTPNPNHDRRAASTQTYSACCISAVSGIRGEPEHTFIAW
jgi:hypothetical protein